MPPESKTVDACNQEGCTEPAAFAFTWPGKDMAGICAGHAPKLRAVANAIGLHVQLLPIVDVGDLLRARRAP